MKTTIGATGLDHEHQEGCLVCAMRLQTMFTKFQEVMEQLEPILKGEVELDLPFGLGSMFKFGKK
jgi:hypothetical protein